MLSDIELFRLSQLPCMEDNSTATHDSGDVASYSSSLPNPVIKQKYVHAFLGLLLSTYILVYRSTKGKEPPPPLDWAETS